MFRGLRIKEHVGCKTCSIDTIEIIAYHRSMNSILDDSKNKRIISLKKGKKVIPFFNFPQILSSLI